MASDRTVSPILESIANAVDYGALTEGWRHSLDAERFSEQKFLYDYQQNALKLAARALYLYFGRDSGGLQNLNLTERMHVRKDDLYKAYTQHQIEVPNIYRYESRANEKNRKQNPVFQILKDYFPNDGNTILFKHLINRMGFWMATGSGKTLVMIKLIEYLHRLIQCNQIPAHRFLILAPSDHLLGQIERTIEEFNQTGLSLEFVPLAKSAHARQSMLGDVATVYYHRSDNISDVQKEVQVDFKRYENDGKWYVFLDEAHKGNKDDSKRQAYYSVMAREGFLFNFSATFTDSYDIVTTVKKFNLEEFVGEGYGKRIYLNQDEFDSFRNRDIELNHNERRKVVLKSLINLAFVSICVKNIRELTGDDTLYHSPLMLTLVNTVNTKIDKEKNDLWTFFQTLLEIAAGRFNSGFFAGIKNELIEDWKHSGFLFGNSDTADLGQYQELMNRITVHDLCEQVFLSREHGALQIVKSKDNKEIAIQMKNADAPFALIRIGQTAKWRTQLLQGYEETVTLQESSYFSALETSSITILMGSRSFFESWDSNRPNVINFINIGGMAAKKFVVQSVGRGVRIEPAQSKRRRHEFLYDMNHIFENVRDLTRPIETLFLYATNRNAIKTVLEGLKSERTGKFEIIDGFIKTDAPKLNGSDMVLLIPQYREVSRSEESHYARFTMSSTTMTRLRRYLESTPDAVFLVRDSLGPSTLSRLRKFVESSNIDATSGRDYENLKFLMFRLVSHMDSRKQSSDGVRKLNDEEDIVHFRKIKTRLSWGEARDLTDKIIRVAQGQLSEAETKSLALKLADNKISFEDFRRKMNGVSELTHRNLRIKHVRKHYYLPIVMADSDNSDFIQHIVKERSEVDFLSGLETWLETNKPEWSGWMFSKIDEYLDRIHIPYYNREINEYARFIPDFIFWMCEGRDFQIVFVDPKGTVHKSAYLKIDGFMHLFEPGRAPVKFKYENWNVSVKLLMFNDSKSVSDLYRRFWTSDYARIFDKTSDTRLAREI